MFSAVLFLLLLGITFFLVGGAIRWRSRSNEMFSALEASRLQRARGVYSSQEIVGLPPPVQRFFTKVLSEGQPVITSVSMEQRGLFNFGETHDNWKPFTARQCVTTCPPGFVWEARVRFFPGIAAHVHDAFVAGKGILHASLFGWIRLIDLCDAAELARGELLRYLAETPWYPTALLPGGGVTWTPVDEDAALATLRVGDVVVSMVFRFSSEGLITSARAEERGRMTKSGIVPTPWEGTWLNYRRVDGILVPTEGEVAWILPEGRRCYWRGTTHNVQYEFAESGT